MKSINKKKNGADTAREKISFERAGREKLIEPTSEDVEGVDRKSTRLNSSH